MKNDIFAGIDYSMSSPAIVICKSEQDSFESCSFYGYRQKKKQVSTRENVILLEPISYNSDEERYWKLGEQFISIMKDAGVTQAFIEGYAYASTGNVFNIGENTGILKHQMWKEGITFGILPPTVVKKYATTKGNANKVAMYNAFQEKYDINLDKLIDDEKKGDKIPSPVSDMIDAYWVVKTGISIHQR